MFVAKQGNPVDGEGRDFEGRLSRLRLDQMG